MSCDYSVWHTTKRFTHDEAGEVHRRLCESDLHDVEPSPRVAAFYAELTALHPEIDTVPDDRIDDHDYCPWSCAMDRSESHVIVCCVWPKADYVGELVERLAKKHHLVLYDPQSGRVGYPPSLPSDREAAPLAPEPRAKKKWWKFW